MNVRYSKEDIAAMLARKAAGETWVEIAASFGVTANAITKAIARHEDPPEPRKSFWTDERLKIAGELWLAGKSAAEISEYFGKAVSRSAVMGKVHRCGWRRNEALALDAKAKVAATLALMNRRRAGKPKPKREPVVRTFKPRSVAAVQIAAPPPDARHWMTRRFGECAAPVSGEGADTFSCCAPVAPGSAWCAEHRARFCVPGKKPLNVRALARVA